MDAIDSAIDPLRDFAKSSARLVQRCHKPDRKGTPIFNFSFLSFRNLLRFLRFILDLEIIFDLSPEFTKVAVRTAIGFVVMGFVGFFVKLVFIPINNIIVGSS